jgi:soluble lytic murein transglycosylase
LLPEIRGLVFAASIAFLTHFHVAAAQTLSTSDQQAMRSVLVAAQSGDFGRAYTEAAAITDPLPLKMLRWMDYARPGAPGRFPDIADFIENNPDWPGQKALRRHAEEALIGESDTVAAAWFQRYPPIGAAGKLREADIMLNSGDVPGATETLRAIWIGADLGPLDEKSFLARYPDAIRP